jgi:sirohydrochlorin cobaltochelatase
MQKNPALTIKYGQELGLHDEMIMAFQHRIMEAVNLVEMPKPGDLYDTMLVVVGRGLEMALKLGFKKIVVAPYFLFSGKLIGRIHAYIDKVAVDHPDVSFHVADYLRDQSHVINTFAERIEETVSQSAVNDGLMEKFQSRLAAGEVTVHHHHAEFQPEVEADSEAHAHSHDQGHGHSHSHGHGHSHQKAEGHSHAPYRHIAHPHGPRTMSDENVCCWFMSQFPQAVVDEERAFRLALGKKVVDQTPQCKVK